LLVCNQQITVVQNAKLIAARPMMIRMKMYPAPIKDHYFLSTILKINDTMDKNYKDKAEKEPGFNRLEEHRKNLILNASATPPFDEKASQPTEFFTAFFYQRKVSLRRRTCWFTVYSQKKSASTQDLHL
jgi:hypothetical protein